MHNPYESSSLGYINTNRKSNYGMDAFYLSYFGKDATWNENIEYIFKQKCKKFRNIPKYEYNIHKI